MNIVSSSTTWPASAAAIDGACDFLQTAAKAAADDRPVVVACRRDVDGLTAAVIVARALDRLGVAEVNLIPAGKGEHIHKASMRLRVQRLAPSRLVVLGMGCRDQVVLLHLPTLVVDHHQPQGFPPHARVVSAFAHPPVAPTSLLAFEITRRLTAMDDHAWLALLGAVATLGNSIPFPHLTPLLDRFGRSAVGEAVALLNAARRAQDYDVAMALSVLLQAKNPTAIARGDVPGVEALRHCRARLRNELRRWIRVPPSIRGRFAVVHVASNTQVHPLLAARWAQRLRRQIVVVANHGYHADRVDFSIRTWLDVDLTDTLRSVWPPSIRHEWSEGLPGSTDGSMAPEDWTRCLAALGLGPGPAQNTRPSTD